jgi:hypothetical protein
MLSLRFLAFLALCGCAFVAGAGLKMPTVAGAVFANKNPRVSTTDANIVAAAAGVEGRKRSLNALDLCLCGAIATVIGDFTMHPVDTIKILQQSSGKGREVSYAVSQYLLITHSLHH